MSIDVTVTLDTRQFEAWAEQKAKQMTNALRSAVDKSARYARRQTIPVMAADSGVPAGRFKAAVPTVQGSRMGGAIVATWAIGKSANNIRNAAGKVPTPARGEAVTVSTFRKTGGGSANLTIQKGFVINANGGRILMIRVGQGRSAIRALYAEDPRTGMLQTDGAPRQVWENAAIDAVSLLAASAVQAALDGAAVPPGPGRFNVGAEL